MPQINYYQTYQDDFVQSQEQNYKLSENYEWIHQNKIYKINSKILYKIAYWVSLIYCRVFLHIKIKNSKILKKYKKEGYFIYGNHTQPIGDVFTPAHICKGKRIYVIANSNNLKVKIIGRLLPILGILPIPDSPKQMKEFLKAVKKRADEKNCIVIYPEAHVWPYYTGIRPMPTTSFKFPVEAKMKSFAVTTTYQKRKWGKKPKITVYVDGPFEPDEKLNKKENQEKLCDEIYKCMQNRSKESTYEYIEYRRKE